MRTYTVTIHGPVRQTSNMIWDFACYAADPGHAAATVIAYLESEFSDDMGFYVMSRLFGSQRAASLGTITRFDDSTLDDEL